MNTPTRADLLVRTEDAEERARLARADRDVTRDQLADLLVVMARWGANLDEGHPAAVLEVLLRDVSAQPPYCRAAVA